MLTKCIIITKYYATNTQVHVHVFEPKSDMCNACVTTVDTHFSQSASLTQCLSVGTSKQCESELKLFVIVLFNIFC